MPRTWIIVILVGILLALEERSADKIARIYTDTSGIPSGLIFYQNGEVVARQIFKPDRVELTGRIPDGTIILYDLDNKVMGQLEYRAGELDLSKLPKDAI